MLIEEIKYFMIVTGTWNPDWTKNSRLRTVQLWYRRTIQSLQLIYFLLLLGKLIQLIQIRGVTEEMFACLSITLTVLVMGIKIFIYQKNTVWRLFLTVINEEKDISLSSDSDVIASYNKDVKFCTKCKNIIIGVTFGIAVFAFLKCINYVETVQKSEKELTEESMMFPIWLPYKDSEALLLATVSNIMLVFVGTNIYVANQSIQVTLMIFTTAQLRILQIYIRKIQSADYKDINYYEALRKIIKKHLFIKSFVSNLNKDISYIMLTDFLINSINIASVAVEILILGTTIRELAFPIVYLLNLLVGVFIMGWFANEIKVQSLALGDVLYETNWYNLDVRTQKMLTIMIQQTQQPLTLSIGPFGPVTLESVLKIMQAAYSYIMLMKNFK